ncbi:dicarboxylate/amino acid:cation symporter [Sporomusa acidovorans]|uniref:Proton/glutamate-aspartate symporter n=1 Tax=Sporomusa acidovorans (strain ATCC 49682 / DSM 3132 / Mol) TaxID=1123286 RepID=A0ABZ3J9A7_SPOA4|nr:cation:dicarboxylase symporter family transporter [Sporomusa acidovorans]OZC22907.1 proton/sodium-glutamate symport protein [Sporomusa acidovorans DSM 3132]SDE95533.1 proton glutamate symport protein [Sporomusa acidovorans]
MSQSTIKPKKGIGLSTQIFLGLILGIIFGYLFPEYGKALKPVGDVFIRMIKMIVVPLVFSSLIMGIAGTGDFKKLGRLGAKSIIWFEIATTFALIVGLFVVNVLQPGVGVTISGGAGGAAADAAKKTIDHMAMIINLVPTNVVDAMARQDMLQIITFSVFFGVAAAAIGSKGRPVIDLAISVAEIMFKFTHYVMMLAPIGIFGSIAYTVGTYGLGMLLPLGKLILSLYLALILFLAIVLVGASLVVRVNFFHVLRALKEPLILAFSTAASEAALPIAMEKLEKFGVPKHIVTFVLPLGYTFNLDGSTLYSALAVVFISQVYGIPFPLETQIIMLITLMLSTKGIAAVPGASLIVIAGTAAAFGLPVEGVAIILGVDRVLDMARTACNVCGNCVASVVVARWEKELPDESLQVAYAQSYEE